MTEKRPIILIGAARSGTKFLRDILASGQGTAAVPYDVNYVWRHGAKTSEDDLLDAGALTEKRKAFIRKTLRQLAKADPYDILIEKTVANTLRIPFVDAVFPEARYVHLIRDGRDVAESAMRQWQVPPNWPALMQKVRDIPLQNLGYVAWFGSNFISGLFKGRGGGSVWGPRFPGIDKVAADASLAEVCARQWNESVTRARQDLSKLPDADKRIFTILYEDLICNEAAWHDLIDKLQLRDQTALSENYRKNLKPNKSSLWKNASAENLKTFERLMTPTLKELGYIK